MCAFITGSVNIIKLSSISVKGGSQWRNLIKTLGLKTQNIMISWDHVSLCYCVYLEADICALLPAESIYIFCQMYVFFENASTILITQNRIQILLVLGVCPKHKPRAFHSLFLMSSFWCLSRGEAVGWGTFKRTILGSFMPKNSK